MGQRQIPWRTLGVEFVVIVLGVLIALAVDRAVQGVDDRALERAYLEALLDEFERGAANTEFAVGFIRERMAMIDVLTAAIETGSVPDSITVEDLARGIELAGWHPGVTFPRVTWEDLINTGRLALITNAEMRRTLADFYIELDFVRDLDASWQRWMEPVQRESGYFLTPRQRLAIARSVFDSTEEVGGLPSRTVFVDRLSERPETYRNLGQALMVAELASGSIQGTAASARRIADMLSSELHR